MAIVVVPSFGADPVTITGPTLDAKVDGLATDYNGNIDNSNIVAGAAIANSKLNLTSVSQDVTLAGTNVLSGATTISGASTISGIMSMSSKILKLAKGADVASVAGAITLGDDGNYFDITGTNAITSITAKTAGTRVVLQFDSTASLVDGSNLKLQGNFSGVAEAQIELVSDGTNWFEVSRNVVTTISAASQAEQETGSSTSVYVSPGRQHFHQSAVKAWAYFSGTATGTNAPTVGYGVTSITRNGAGDYTVNLSITMSSSNYAVMVTLGNTTLAGVVTANPTNATTFGILARNLAGSATDADTLNIMVLGDI